MKAAVNWFNQNSEIPIKHDQTLIHIAALLGDWKLLNLCKAPHNWLSTWSGDYKNSLDLIHAIQGCEERTSTEDEKVFISHLHYSGRGRLGYEPIDELIFSNQTNKNRMMLFFKIQCTDLFLITYVKEQMKRVKRYLNRKMATNK